MRKGKCIYCNEEKKLNKEHAFPRFLLHNDAPGWTIYKHSCVECNEKLGKLDEILASRGPIGHTWNQIKSESGEETKEKQSYRYERKVHQIKPERMLIPDPILGDRIGLFKLLVEGNDREEPLYSLEPLVPQMILTLYAEEETIEDVIEKNVKQFASLKIISVEVSSTSESVLTYMIGNPLLSTTTVVFPPEAIIYFHHAPQDFAEYLKQFDSIPKEYTISEFRKELQDIESKLTPKLDNAQKEKIVAYLRKQEQDFESTVSKQLDGIQKELLIIKDEKNTEHDMLTSFVDSVLIDNKMIVDEEIYFKEETYANLSRSEPLRGRFLIDEEVEQYIWRAVAKIAFHCFLKHYDKFSGHESMFDSIKAFIYKEGVVNSFVTSHVDIDFENPVYSSNEHFHYISFLVDGRNIGCRMDLFTGLSNGSFPFQVTLAGNIENWNVVFNRTERVPFYMNPKSEKKKRIYFVNSLGMIQEPSLEQTLAFGIKHD
jgi:hypothetical protein